MISWPIHIEFHDFVRAYGSFLGVLKVPGGRRCLIMVPCNVGGTPDWLNMQEIDLLMEEEFPGMLDAVNAVLKPEPPFRREEFR